ncbi:hypothetical protein [Paenibacillus hamazuiensis]|uniref:hypothetical protein n=1 Tax=Paenibacillus hamazuiensis TaxID=2936508 RepID=UPI0030840F49
MSRLSLAEAQRVLDELKRNGHVFASKRSADYMAVRRELEAKARELFIRKGGRPVNDYPHYMTVEACSWIKSWYENGRELALDIDEFDESSISFTYGDLFPTMRFKDGKSYRGNVYTKPEIFRLIQTFGLSQAWNADGSKGPERYIEVQIWDDAVVGKYIGQRDLH